VIMKRLRHILGAIKERYILSLIVIFTLMSTSAGESLKERYSADNIRKAEQLNTFRSIGTIKIGGTIGTIETYFSKPGQSRSILTLENFKIIQIFDGKRAWMKDQNGQVIELTGPDKEQLVNTGWLMGKSYLLKSRMPGATKFIRDTVINLENYSVYSALPDGGDSLELYFSPESGRIEIIGEYLDETEIFTYLSDFREVDGIEMPYSYETKSIIPELNSTVEIYEFDINPRLDDTLFAFSINPADDYFFPDNADSVVVPIVYRGGHIFLKAAIDGHPAVYFILDSGAGINILSRRYADSLRLDFSGGIPAKGMSGYEATTVTGIDSLRIGDLKLLRQKMAIIDLSGIGLSVPDGLLGGLLGYDLLSRFPLRIDYVGETLIFYNPVVYQPPSIDYAVDLEYNMKVPVVDAEICGASGKFLIDLGNSLGLILHRPFVDANNLNTKFTDINDITRDISGVGGKSEAYSAMAAYFAFGPAYLKELRILVADGNLGILKSTEVDGNIGNGLLQNFNVIVDYPGQKIYIMPLKYR